ncbi:MAG: hypothetical protein IK117_02085 [Bacteroidales bacterium]|nr:hypothetical protein [Bacteroidales bacterium]
MRPIKNRVFCPRCGRTKIQFETKQKALLFLEYNAKTIQEETGHAPIRCYYCNTCKCWHVTSRPEHSHDVKAKYHRSHYERCVDRTAKARIRYSLKEIKAMLHEINRFVLGNKDRTKELFLYYRTLFYDALMAFETISKNLSIEQINNINHRICIVKPYFV